MIRFRKWNWSAFVDGFYYGLSLQWLWDKRIICAFKGHKRGVRVSTFGNEAVYRCPRCWQNLHTRKVKQKVAA